MEKPTERQLEAAGAIKNFVSKYGYPPTVRELAGMMGIDVRAAFEHIKALEKKGFLSTEKGKARSITLAETPSPFIFEDLPVLGRLPAGGPVLVEENITDALPVEKGWFGRGQLFAVEVEGESMTGAGIMPGDYAVAKAQEEAENGDIIIAIVDGESTIKRYSKKQNRVTLLPANPRFRPIKVSGGFRVAGKVVGIIRKY